MLIDHLCGKMGVGGGGGVGQRIHLGGSGGVHQSGLH